MLESIKKYKKTIGIKQTLKALESDLLKNVFIAKDADELVVSNIKVLCNERNVEIIYLDTMKMLGKACGIEVGAAAVGLLKTDEG